MKISHIIFNIYSTAIFQEIKFGSENIFKIGYADDTDIFNKTIDARELRRSSVKNIVIRLNIDKIMQAPRMLNKLKNRRV